MIMEMFVYSKKLLAKHMLQTAGKGNVMMRKGLETSNLAMLCLETTSTANKQKKVIGEDRSCQLKQCSRSALGCCPCGGRYLRQQCHMQTLNLWIVIFFTINASSLLRRCQYFPLRTSPSVKTSSI